MKPFRIVLLILVLTLINTIAFAATADRRGFIQKIQASSSDRVGLENIVWIEQQEIWSPAVNCKPDWAYIKGDLDSHMLSLLLTAKIVKLEVKMAVDDTYPKIDGYCRIIQIKLY